MSIPSAGPDILQMDPLARQVLDVVGSDLTGVQQALGGLMGNLLVNGGMWYNQRLGLPGFTNPFTGNGTISSDRWQSALFGGSTLSVSIGFSSVGGFGVADAPRPSLDYVQLDYLHGTGPAYLQQYVEDGARFAGMQVALSAYVDADHAGMARLFLDSGAGPVYSPYHTGGYVSGNHQWQRLELVASLPSNANMLHAGIALDNVSGQAFFTGAMLIPGSQPVDYVPRPRWLERLACQRYFEVHGNGQTQWPYMTGHGTVAGDQAYAFIPFAVNKGGVPTVVKFGTWNVQNVAQPIISAPGPHGYFIGGSSIVVAPGFYQAFPDGVGQGAYAQWNPPATDF